MKLYNGLTVLASAVALASTAALAVDTPEQRAGAGGQIANPSTLEYYFGTISAGASSEGVMLPRISGLKANLSWYKFTSDGQTGIVFDTFGSAFGFGGGSVLAGGNTSELAVFDSSGNYIASTEGVRGPATGDSNRDPVQPAGSYPLGAQAYRQARDPRNPAINWYAGPPVYNPNYPTDVPGWRGGNANGLSQLAFVKNAQANPVWDPNHPQYTPNADWDEYPVLPAGDYFLAVVGYSTYFSGYARDNAGVTDSGDDFPFASGAVTPTTPFGFVTYSPHSGVYKLQARLPGDLTLDGSVTSDDRELLKSKILEFTSTKGIAAAGYVNGNPAEGWQGLPANLADPANELQRFDLTGNSRIDIYDLFQFARWTELPAPIFGDANLDDVVDFDDLLILAQNYGRTDEPQWTEGDFSLDELIGFDDLLGLAQNYGYGTLIDSDFESDWALARSIVPEPSSLALLSMLTLRSRRRSRR